MLPFSKFHAATLLDLHKWSTLSRNEVGPVIARFGIQPLGRKYPMLRVYEHLLGLSPSNPAEADMLGAGLMRVTKVAEWFGVSSDDLLDAVRSKNNDYPPLYALGPKRHLFLKAQIKQLLASPRNEFHCLTLSSEHALPHSRLARHLNVPQARVDELLKEKANLPARIFSRGHVRFIVSDVADRLASFQVDEVFTPAAKPTDDEGSAATVEVAHASTTKARPGLFAGTAAHATGDAQAPRSCT